MAKTRKTVNKEIYGEVPEVVHNAVLNALDSLDTLEPCASTRKVAAVVGKSAVGKRPAGKKRAVSRLPRIAVASVACLLLCGITASAVGVINEYKQRMKDMDQDTVEQYYEIVMAGQTEETIGQNRHYTEQERVRYEALNEAYEKNGLFPEVQIPYLQDADAYTGEGLALDPSTDTLYLPDRELSDEELLEIIDLQHKIVYSIYKWNEAKIVSGSDWQRRMAALSDEEVDEIYLTTCSTTNDVSGGYNREMSESEERRYGELMEGYEQDGLFVDQEMPVIQTPAEYDGRGIAICVETGSYYFPERELTDEELLQLIDLQHKESYCLDRLLREVQMGLREGYPHF